MLILLRRFAIALLFCLPAGAQTWFSNVTKNPAVTSCTVGWTTAVPTIAHIEYGLAAGSYAKSTADSAAYFRTKSQTISGLTPSTKYHFRIAASDSSRDWIRSLDYTCTTGTTTSQHSVRLNWYASNSSGVTAYNVYRTTISGGYYALLGSASSLTYTDNGVQPGTTYYYVVAALNGAGQQSPYSSQVRAAVP